MLDDYLVQTCYKVSPSRDEYSDYIDGAHTAMACRFREISTMRRGARGEENDSDAMLWLLPNAPVAIGNIILFENNNYQIERLTKARRLGEDSVQFLKADLKITDVGVS